MYRIIVLTFLAFMSLIGFSQEKPPKATMENVKSQMVLRSNTRDKMVIVKDNMHRQQMAKRKQAMISHQQKMMKNKMQHVQKKRMQKQRMVQQRKLRQQAMRRRQMQQRR